MFVLHLPCVHLGFPIVVDDVTVRCLQTRKSKKFRKRFVTSICGDVSYREKYDGASKVVTAH